MNSIHELYTRMRQLPFPRLGGITGDFLLYDSLLAGIAHNYVLGQRVVREEIPIPDMETQRIVKNLREQPVLNEEEKAFLDYVNVLEELQSALEQETNPLRQQDNS